MLQIKRKFLANQKLSIVDELSSYYKFKIVAYSQSYASTNLQNKKFIYSYCYANKNYLLYLKQPNSDHEKPKPKQQITKLETLHMSYSKRVFPQKIFNNQKNENPFQYQLRT